MNRVMSVAMPSTLNLPTSLSAPSLIEHGLLIGVSLGIVSAAFSLEALEILTGIVGALAIYVMKDTNFRRQKCGLEPCQATLSSKVSSSGLASPMQNAEVKTQSSITDGVAICEQEHAQLSACAHAELNTMRAENQLSSWKFKVECEEAEHSQLKAKMVELEKNLVQEDMTETQIEAVLTDLTEVKLRAEEVEAELVWSHTKRSELERDVAQALSTQRKTEELAQTPIEALSTDLMDANFQWTEEHMEMFWPDDLCEPLDKCQ